MSGGERALAPIAVFAYNRPHHLRKTMEALAACPEAGQSHLLAFCDGPRNDEDRARIEACREVLLGRDWCATTTLTSQASNLGLAGSIERGVAAACAQWGRVIVLEDDVRVGRHFLAHMNAALDRYRDDARVVQVSGHSFPAHGYSESGGSSFLPFPTTWGWATWRRAWEGYDRDMSGIDELDSDPVLRKRFDLDGSYPYYRMLTRLRRSGRLGNSWGIRWYWSIFKSQSLVLYPHRTLTSHFGEDGSGTNVGPMRRSRSEFDPDHAVLSLPDRTGLDRPYFAAVKRHLARQNTFLRRGERLLHRVLQRTASGR